jgi:hypothetical protein
MTGSADQRPIFKVIDMKEKTKNDIDGGIKDVQKGVRTGIKDVQKGVRTGIKDVQKAARDVGGAIDKGVKKADKKIKKS